MKNTWKILKEITNRKQQSNISDEFSHNGTAITDHESIANHFNNCFVNIGPSLASKTVKPNHMEFDNVLDNSVVN